MLLAGCGGVKQRPAGEVVVLGGGGRATLLEKQVDLQRWEYPDAPGKADKEKVPKAFLPSGYFVSDVADGAHHYAVLGARARAGESAVDGKVWLFNKQWKLLGQVQGMPFSQEQSFFMGWLHEGQTLGIVVSEIKRPDENLRIGKVDLNTLQWREIQRLDGLSEVAWAWLKNDLILSFMEVRPQQNKVVAIDFKTHQLRTFFSESSQPLANRPFDTMEESPDKTRVALGRGNPFKNHSSGIWLLDMKSGAFGPLTSESRTPYYHLMPIWRDNRTLQFFRRELGVKGYNWNLYQVSLPQRK